MSESKDIKKKSFADIFKNILKETKKDKDPKKDNKEENLEKKNKSPPTEPNDNNTIQLKEVVPTNKSEKIIFYEERANSINDETIFDFMIKGGPKHSDLLVACASYKNSKGGGEPVALNCKWFNVTDNNELREIEGVTGAFYQPCADDIGTRLCVQAVPILGLKEYTGMPIFAEIGPLIIDEDIEKMAYENFDKELFNFSIKIEAISLNILPEYLPSLPNDGEIEIKDNNLYISYDDNDKKCELTKIHIGSSDFPNIVLIKKSNNIFEIYISETEKIKCSTRTNRERDAIALSIRLLSGRNMTERQVQTIEEIKEENDDNKEVIEENHKENIDGELVRATAKHKKEKFELYLKLEQLTKDVLRLTKEKDNNKIEQRNLTDSFNNAKKEIGETKEKLDNCTKNYYELLEENKNLKKNIELYMNEKLFLFQELDIYKKQIEEYEKLKSENPLSKAKIEDNGKSKKRTSNSLKSLSKESLLTTINDLNCGIIKLEAEIKEKNIEITLKTQNIKELTSEKEELLNDLNYIKKKNESLLHEKSINFLPKPKTEEKIEIDGVDHDLSISPEKNSLECQVNLKKTMDIKNLENLEEEIKKLKDKIKNQEITIETLKIGLSEEISKKNEKPKSSLKTALFGKSSQNASTKEQILKKTINDWNFLQKLVNVLTETIADKDLALENQKQINKELMKRLEESRFNAVILEKQQP